MENRKCVDCKLGRVLRAAILGFGLHKKEGTSLAKLVDEPQRISIYPLIVPPASKISASLAGAKR